MKILERLFQKWTRCFSAYSKAAFFNNTITLTDSGSSVDELILHGVEYQANGVLHRTFPSARL